MRTRHPIDPQSSFMKLDRRFYTRDILEVAPELIGKYLVLTMKDKPVARLRITEVEAYRGEEDKACHAARGRTKRTEIMYHKGGHVYVYFVYGMYWMLNIVAGKEGDPQAALIRGAAGYDGPGKLTKALEIDGSFYGEDLTRSGRIWIEDSGEITDYTTGPRIGIAYSGEPWISKPWRYHIK